MRIDIIPKLSKLVMISLFSSQCPRPSCAPTKRPSLKQSRTAPRTWTVRPRASLPQLCSGWRTWCLFWIFRMRLWGRWTGARDWSCIMCRYIENGNWTTYITEFEALLCDRMRYCIYEQCTDPMYGDVEIKSLEYWTGGRLCYSQLFLFILSKTLGSRVEIFIANSSFIQRKPI